MKGTAAKAKANAAQAIPEMGGRILIRHASSGKKYLYDILEIKKETGKSCQT